MARATVIDKTNFLSEQMSPLSSETSVNLLKMENKDYYRLLINTKKKKPNSKQKQSGLIIYPLESFFSEKIYMQRQQAKRILL